MAAFSQNDLFWTLLNDNPHFYLHIHIHKSIGFLQYIMFNLDNINRFSRMDILSNLLSIQEAIFDRFWKYKTQCQGFLATLLQDIKTVLESWDIARDGLL